MKRFGIGITMLAALLMGFSLVPASVGAAEFEEREPLHDEDLDHSSAGSEGWDELWANEAENNTMRSGIKELPKKKQPLISNWDREIQMSRSEVIRLLKWKHATTLRVHHDESGSMCGGKLYEFKLSKVIYAPGSDTEIVGFNIVNMGEAAYRQCPQVWQVPCKAEFVRTFTNEFEISRASCDTSATIPPDWE